MMMVNKKYSQKKYRKLNIIGLIIYLFLILIHSVLFFGSDTLTPAFARDHTSNYIISYLIMMALLTGFMTSKKMWKSIYIIFAGLVVSNFVMEFFITINEFNVADKADFIAGCIGAIAGLICLKIINEFFITEI